MRHVIVGLLVAALAVLAVSPARAGDDTRQKVLTLYRDATRSYNIAEYREALDLYKQGYKLSGDPAFLFNIGQCHRQLGESASAAQAYRAFLRSKPDATNRGEVEQRIADMDKLAAQEQARKPPNNIEPPQGAHTLPVDNGHTTPLVTTPPPPPPVEKPPAAPVLTPPPPPPPVEEHAASRPWYKQGLFWGLVGGGVVLAAAAVVLGIVLGGAPSDPVPTVGAIRGGN